MSRKEPEPVAYRSINRDFKTGLMYRTNFGGAADIVMGHAQDITTPSPGANPLVKIGKYASKPFVYVFSALVGFPINLMASGLEISRLQPVKVPIQASA